MAKDWYEQALVSETRIKAFFGATLTAQRKLINDATRVEAEIEVHCPATPPTVPPAAPQTPLVACDDLTRNATTTECRAA